MRTSPSSTKCRQPDNNSGGDIDKARYDRTMFPRKLDAFLKAEGAVAWVRMSARDNGLIHGTGYRYRGRPDAAAARRRDRGRGLSPVSPASPRSAR